MEAPVPPPPSPLGERGNARPAPARARPHRPGGGNPEHNRAARYRRTGQLPPLCVKYHNLQRSAASTKTSFGCRLEVTTR